MHNESLAGQLILQLILILVNAFFAATEIAFISLNENKLKSRLIAVIKRRKEYLVSYKSLPVFSRRYKLALRWPAFGAVHLRLTIFRTDWCSGSEKAGV
jgi:putative hemolysin